MTERPQLSILYIQKTKLAVCINFRIPGYSIESQDEPISHMPHNRVVVSVPSSISYERIELQTPVQAIAIGARLHNTVTVCNIYAPGSQLLNCQMLDDIYRQLSQPIIFLEDFNAYNRLWGSNTTILRETQVEKFLEKHNLVLLNNGAPTRVVDGAETSLGLTMCSANIAATFDWSISAPSASR